LLGIFAENNLDGLCRRPSASERGFPLFASQTVGNIATFSLWKKNGKGGKAAGRNRRLSALCALRDFPAA